VPFSGLHSEDSDMAATAVMNKNKNYDEHANIPICSIGKLYLTLVDN